MNNVVEFPQSPRVRVSNGIEVETGRNIYVFELVDGKGRDVIATRSDVQDCAALVSELMGDGLDVCWERLNPVAGD